MTDSDPQLLSLNTALWQDLKAASEKSGHCFGTAVLATTMGRSNVDQRTVVIRRVDPDKRELVIHSDVRAAKVEQIRKFPKISLLFWDTDNSVQLRIAAEAKVFHRGKHADSEWQRTPVKSRTIYGVIHKPGEEIEPDGRFLPRELTGINIDPAALQEGRKNFCAISAIVTSVQWLQIKTREHRRARFDYTGAGTDPDHACWLGP